MCDIIQDSRTGWLAETGTPELEAANFERVISLALNSTEVRNNASGEAEKWALTWRWSEAMERAIDTYHEAIQGQLCR